MAAALPTVIDDVRQAFQTNLVGFAGFTVLIWDHVDTFTEEACISLFAVAYVSDSPLQVEHIWGRKKTLITYLFILNRYLTPLGFMVNLYAYLSPVWTPEICAHFIRYEGAMTMIGIQTVATMMFLRIRALYDQKKWIIGGVGCLLAAQGIVYAYLLTKGQRVEHNPDSGVRACTMIFPPELFRSTLAASSAWIPLLYDTVVFGLTLYRTISAIQNKTQLTVIRRILEDGILYYSIIFAINLILTLMILSAPPGLKNITAQLELLITVAMMSRITLNLKKGSGTSLPTVRAPEFLRRESSAQPPSKLRVVNFKGFRSNNPNAYTAHMTPSADATPISQEDDVIELSEIGKEAIY
ncbi:hypothetical protein C8J56DRAFT_1124651 [Mycena floridula]|nr:hypothetical protein C8J56DRAFT_1124651 [Mycena floridula]